MGVWPCGRVGVCLVVGQAMRSVQKTRVKLFRPSFSTGGCSRKSQDFRLDPVEKVEFSTGSASRNSQSKKVESKKAFCDCVRKPDLGFSRKRPFSTDKSDCMRNGLRLCLFRFDLAEISPTIQKPQQKFKSPDLSKRISYKYRRCRSR